MPKVLRDQIAASSNNNNNKGSRSFSTSAYNAQQEQQQKPEPTQQQPTEPTVAEVAEMIAVASGQQPAVKTEEKVGHKFGIPTLPIPRSEIMKRRYDPLVEHFTKLMMHSGKLALAQRVSSSLYYAYYALETHGQAKILLLAR